MARTNRRISLPQPPSDAGRTSPRLAAGVGLAGWLLGTAGVVLAATFLAVDDPTLPMRYTAWIPAVCAAAAATWLLGGLAERRLGRHVPQVTAVLGGLALAVTLLIGGPSLKVAQGTSVRGWNLFHYHLGSKYFPELGYTGLYAACLATDDAWQAHKATLSGPEREAADAVRDFAHVDWVRDQTTYRIRRRARAVEALDRRAFTPDRWDALAHDCRQARTLASKSKWPDIFKDRGYNPVPGWTVFGRPLAEALPLEGRGLWWLAMSDAPILVGVFAMLWWGFGPRVAAVAWLFLVTVSFNHARLLGGMLQYDWLLSIVACFALWRRGWPATSGVALSWGVMTRAFPAVLALPALTVLASEALARARRRPGDPRSPAALRFAGALAAACGVWALLTLTAGRGAAIWPEWVDTIRVHSAHHVLGSRRLGVKRLALHQPTPDDFWHEADGNQAVLIAHAAGRAPWVQLVALIPLALALRNRRTDDAMILMLYLAFVLVVSSRYYGSAWLMLAALGTAADPRAPPTTANLLAGAGLLGLSGWMALNWPTPDGQYFAANYAALVVWSAVCLVLLADGPARAAAEAR